MRRVSWTDIPGWETEDHAAAWAAFSVSAHLIGLSDIARVHPTPREAFELLFDPYEVVPAGKAFYTGYYEPEIAGSPVRTERFRAALYAVPPGLKPPAKWFTRAEIAARHLLDGHEIAWVETPLDAFFAQVQGSVRLKMTDGSSLRLGFAAKNGHPYRSIGAELIRRGVAKDGMSPERIRDWAGAHPDELQGLLNHNPSFVFFRALDLPALSGPVGAAGLPVMAGRTLAVDPAVVSFGSPVWVDCAAFGRRLTFALDTGTAIRGAGRGDLFFGSGPEAGAAAGAVRHNGSMIVLKRRT
ncbi:murein transglycosylase A [Paenirhodobacter enshiensis]|uniref:peptidoglycan lytic exotransglycosylase n=1 Tax=Paenirhodobacter enshiensis TaxID=1105367 RepID=A0A086Y3K4_9RHOB|nr:murein transglycosylase A [Paenirhodobacter enshiensis]KFI28854.1 hypothetical protein CG50_11615 [Paenirhodobacter enshiensis]